MAELPGPGRGAWPFILNGGEWRGRWVAMASFYRGYEYANAAACGATGHAQVVLDALLSASLAGGLR